MRAISSSVQPECIIINQCSQYTINSSAFPVWSWRLYCTCLSVFLFIFSANFFGHFSPDNYDLVGVRGADGGVGAWGGRGGKRGRWSEEGGEAFTPRLLIPLLKGFCSIMPDSFRK